MSTHAPETWLDVDELEQLAYRAIEQGKNEEALTFTKRALALEPDNASLNYLLGLVHADLGLLQKAIEEIGHSLQLVPDFALARFHLGLLYLAAGEAASALNAWSPFAQRGEQDPLRLFQIGLVCLTRNELEKCVVQLERGLALSADESVNPLMRRVAREAKSALASVGATPPPGETRPETASPVSRIRLKAYEEDKDT